MIRCMFSEIAPRYDLLNRLLTLGSDQAWQRQACALIKAPPGAVVLDVGGGTGDTARAWLQEHPDTGRLVVADFAEPMLRIARRKLADQKMVSLVCCDALELPGCAGCFDVVMAGFAVRNFSDLDAGLQEMARLTRPGGQVLILEMCGNRAVWLAELFRRYGVPLVGWVLTGHRHAYNYLAESTQQFATPEQLKIALERAGFRNIAWRHLTWRIATAVWGTKP